MRYVFGEWTLDTQRAELSRAGQVRRLRRKAFQVLAYLLAHADRVVSKQELCEQVWPQQFISDAALEGTVRAVRQAIGDSGRGQRLIQTVYGQGYRFIAAVVVQPEVPAGGHGAGHLAPCSSQPTLPQGTEALVPALSPPETGGSAAGIPETATEAEEASLQPRASATAGEWKLVTVLCCALAKPPTEASCAVESHYHALQTLSALAQEAVQRYGGTLQPVVGDQILALFGAPQAQEDHARCAVLAALDLLERLHPPALGAGLAVRMGVPSGLTVVGELGPEAHGPVTVVGAPAQGALRLGQQAAPGTLLVSAATYHLVQAEVRGEPWGSLVLDGLQEPLQVYAVQGLVQRRAGVPQRATPVRSPFVGRQRELALLHDRLEVVRGGEGQVVSLVGPPGIGKTRLLMEFGRGLAPDRVTWVLGQCLAYGQAMPYLPVRDLVRHMCALVESEPLEARTAAVRRRLAVLGEVAEEDVALMCHLLDLPVAWRQQLVAHGAGNPFFLEELAWHAVEHHLDDTPIPVPETVHAVLAARLDRLPAVAKALLQRAAVIGPEAPLPLVQALAELPEDTVQQGLAHLQDAQVLYESCLVPERVYTFKHALTQEVAYGSLLQEQRRALHARIVEALERLAGDRRTEQVERLAHHALRGAVWDKAVTYCQQAGARAHDRAAFHEAVTYFDQALQALAHLPEPGDTTVLAIELRLALGDALNALGEYRRRLALLGEAAALARALDDRARLGRVFAQIAQVLRITGDADGAIVVGRQALELAAALGESALQAEVSHRLGQIYYAIGDFGRTAELLRWNVEAADRASGTPSTDVRIQSQAWLAGTLSTLGAFVEGRRHGKEALRLATLEGRGVTSIIAHGCLGHVYLTQGDLEQALRVLEQGLTLCRASGNRDWLRGIMASLGSAYALQGRLAEGRALLEEAISVSIHTGARQRPLWVAWLSEVWRLAGRGAEAWQHARQALDLARQQKDRGEEGVALYQLGVVQAHADPPDAEQAEAHYRQALALAEALDMRPLQAHCHRGLGTLYAEIGETGQARVALSAAADLYRAMDMAFWLPQTEVALAQVEG